MNNVPQTMLHIQPNKRNMVVKSCRKATQQLTSTTLDFVVSFCLTLEPQRTLIPDRKVPSPGRIMLQIKHTQARAVHIAGIASRKFVSFEAESFESLEALL